MSDAPRIELNEPLFLRALPLVVASLLAGAARPLRGGLRPAFVAYAIENLNITTKIASHLKLPPSLVESIARPLIQTILRRFDRVAFGTAAAQQAYTAAAGQLPGNLRVELIEALEPSCNVCSCDKIPRSLLFLGAFEDRKGIDIIMRAWPMVRNRISDTTLTIIGKGPLLPQVENWANARPEVNVWIDPLRADIHAALSTAQVLALPSRSSARWREQIGLPIVEALSHGCRIVTSQSTGIADWLMARGHHVLPEPANVEQYIDAITSAFGVSPTSPQILDSLPSQSGRQAAEYFLWH